MLEQVLIMSEKNLLKKICLMVNSFDTSRYYDFMPSIVSGTGKYHYVKVISLLLLPLKVQIGILKGFLRKED